MTDIILKETNESVKIGKLINQTISSWANTSWTKYIKPNLNAKNILIAGSWIMLNVAVGTTFDVLCNITNLGQEWDTDEIWRQSKQLSVIAISTTYLFVSFLRRMGTNFATSHSAEIGKTNNASLKDYGSDSNKLSNLITDILKQTEDLKKLKEEILTELKTKNIPLEKEEPKWWVNTIIPDEIRNTTLMVLVIYLGMAIGNIVNIMRTEIGSQSQAGTIYDINYRKIWNTFFSEKSMALSFAALFIIKIKFFLLDKSVQSLEQMPIMKRLLGIPNELLKCILSPLLTDEQNKRITKELNTLTPPAKNLKKMIEEYKDISKKLKDSEKLIDKIATIGVSTKTNNNTENKQNKYHTLLSLDTLKHSGLWFLGTGVSATIDSLYCIIATRLINASKHNSTANSLEVEFYTSLAILWSLNTVGISIMGQIGFKTKLWVTDWTLNSFKKTKFYKTILSTSYEWVVQKPFNYIKEKFNNFTNNVFCLPKIIATETSSEFGIKTKLHELETINNDLKTCYNTLSNQLIIFKGKKSFPNAHKKFNKDDNPNEIELKELINGEVKPIQEPFTKIDISSLSLLLIKLEKNETKESSIIQQSMV